MGFASTIINLLLPYEAGNFLPSLATISFLKVLQHSLGVTRDRYKALGELTS
jgi:hypothetical protein